MYASWPSCPCMQQLLPCGFGKVKNRSFCDTILKMGIDSTKSESLLLLLSMLLEFIVSKMAIVTVIVANFDAKLTCELFLCCFDLSICAEDWSVMNWT